MANREGLITDLLLKMAMDESIPVEKRVDIALALQSEKTQHQQNQHELKMKKIKEKPAIQRTFIEQRMIDNELPKPEVEENSFAKVNSILDNYKAGSEEAKPVEGAAAHG